MDDYIHCNSCQQMILSSNYQIHSLYCQRNSVTCTICDEIFDLTQQESHNESHIYNTCKYCQVYQKDISNHKCPLKKYICDICNCEQQEFNRENHKIQCEQQLILCQYCNTQILRGKLMLHVPLCKKQHSQQEQCKNCGKIIQITNCQQENEMNIHLEECLKNPKYCIYCHLQFPIIEFNEHIKYCETKTFQCDFCQKRIMNKDQNHELECFQKKNKLIKEIKEQEEKEKKIEQLIHQYDDEIDDYLDQLEQQQEQE